MAYAACRLSYCLPPIVAVFLVCLDSDRKLLFEKVPLNWEEDLEMMSKFVDRKVRNPTRPKGKGGPITCKGSRWVAGFYAYHFSVSPAFDGGAYLLSVVALPSPRGWLLVPRDTRQRWKLFVFEAARVS